MDSGRDGPLPGRPPSEPDAQRTTPPERVRPLLLDTAVVLRRGRRQVQIGALPDTAFVLADVHPALPEVLALCDGGHPLEVIRSRARAHGIASGELDWVLRTLDDAGLLRPGQRPPDPPPGLGAVRLRLVGAGRLGRAVAHALCHAGAGRLYIIDGTPVDPLLYPTPGPGATQADALRRSLGDGLSVVSVVNHWTKPEGVDPALTLVCCDAAECDRVIADDLLRADQPHLFLHAVSGGAVLGPLVVPGHTPCLRCLDLHRRDADPSWPVLLAQLTRSRVVPAPAVLAWAAAVATTQVLAFLADQAPETFAATVSLAPPRYRTERRVWRAHPDCGCCWGVAAEWTP